MAILSLSLVILGACSIKNNQNGQSTLPPTTTLRKINGLSFVGGRQILDSTHFEPVKAVKAGWISVMPYAFARPDCTELWYDQKRQWQGEKREGIAQTIALAREANLKIMLKPHLWIGRGGFTGHYEFKNEQDWQAWEENYKEYILKYAILADSLEVEMLCIGTELDRFVQARPNFWHNMIKELRQIYKGKLTYAANWDEYPRVPFWKSLDYIGIDAYFPLTESQNPSLEEILKAWQKHFDPIKTFSEKNNLPILFTEFGYQSIQGTTIRPWEESQESIIDYEAQEIALEALFQKFYTQEWFVGGFLWKWFPIHERAGGENKDFTPQNKPAQKKIAEWYQRMKFELNE